MPTLLVLLKYPSVGQVKTRLARSIGPQRAAAMYRDWIGTVLELVQPLRSQVRVIGFFDGAPSGAFQTWETLADEWWSQPAGNLSDRLEAGFSRAFSEDSPVVAIGTDCLEIERSLIQTAFAQLEGHDVVFGPTFDGGYYLVGTRENQPNFFRGVSWSSRDTLASHQAACDDNGWSVAMLPMLRDIDTWEDWQAHCRERGRCDG